MGVETVQWIHDEGKPALWRKDSAIIPRATRYQIPDPRGGFSWKRMIGASRASETIYEFEPTPPPSKHPTPLFDEEPQEAGEPAQEAGLGLRT